MRCSARCFVRCFDYYGQINHIQIKKIKNIILSEELKMRIIQKNNCDDSNYETMRKDPKKLFQPAISE